MLPLLLLLLLLPLLATVANVLSTEFALTAAAKIFHFKFAMRDGEKREGEAKRRRGIYGEEIGGEREGKETGKSKRLGREE